MKFSSNLWGQYSSHLQSISRKSVLPSLRKVSEKKSCTYTHTRTHTHIHTYIHTYRKCSARRTKSGDIRHSDLWSTLIPLVFQWLLYLSRRKAKRCTYTYTRARTHPHTNIHTYTCIYAENARFVELSRVVDDIRPFGLFYLLISQWSLGESQYVYFHYVISHFYEQRTKLQSAMKFNSNLWGN